MNSYAPTSPPNHGLFITFEGGEGTGKSTQCRKLAQWLSERGHNALLTREPGGTPEAEKIRDLLVQRDGGEWSPMAECLLHFAARHMHLEHLIRPAIDEGRVVISDRFTDSTRAYQGYGLGLDRDRVEQVKATAIGGFEPDLTLILDIDPVKGLERSSRHLSGTQDKRESAEDRYERLDISFHERLRSGFLDIARHDPRRCHVIDAGQDVDTVFEEITSLVKARLDEHV